MRYVWLDIADDKVVFFFKKKKIVTSASLMHKLHFRFILVRGCHLKIRYWQANTVLDIISLCSRARDFWDTELEFHKVITGRLG